MAKAIQESWFRSESALKRHLETLGLVGLNGRVYRNGMVLRLDSGMYGQYSKQSWYLHFRCSEVQNVQ